MTCADDLPCETGAEVLYIGNSLDLLCFDLPIYYYFKQSTGFLLGETLLHIDMDVVASPFLKQIDVCLLSS